MIKTIQDILDMEDEDEEIEEVDNGIPQVDSLERHLAQLEAQVDNEARLLNASTPAGDHADGGGDNDFEEEPLLDSEQNDVVDRVVAEVFEAAKQEDASRATTGDDKDVRRDILEEQPIIITGVTTTPSGSDEKCVDNTS